MGDQNTKISRLEDNTERMWFLGTDILHNKDLELMNKQVRTAFHREEGAIYSVGKSWRYEYKADGYSDRFIEVMMEAQRRGYVWVFFDRDIESEIDPKR